MGTLRWPQGRGAAQGGAQSPRECQQYPRDRSATRRVAAYLNDRDVAVTVNSTVAFDGPHTLDSVEKLVASVCGAVRRKIDLSDRVRIDDRHIGKG